MIVQLDPNFSNFVVLAPCPLATTRGICSCKRSVWWAPDRPRFMQCGHYNTRYNIRTSAACRQPSCACQRWHTAHTAHTCDRYAHTAGHIHMATNSSRHLGQPATSLLAMHPCSGAWLFQESQQTPSTPCALSCECQFHSADAVAMEAHRYQYPGEGSPEVSSGTGHIPFDTAFLQRGSPSCVGGKGPPWRRILTSSLPNP